jgi:hypothetical protein
MRRTGHGASVTDMRGMSSPGPARTLGVDAAAEHPLIRPSRSWRNKRASTGVVGAVSAVSVLVLFLHGDVPELPGLVPAFCLGLLAAATTSRSRRERAEPVAGDPAGVP